jgi:HEAT repeat protein
MDLQQIETDLLNQDFNYRTKAISALKAYPPEVAVPILSRHVKDPEFLVRSFVARELGSQQTAESFAALLQIMKLDNTPNVRAEAANSLSLFGVVAAPHLVQTFLQDDHWLLRRSILAAMMEMDCPEELFEVAVCGISSDDISVQDDSISALASFVHTDRSSDALTQILAVKDHHFFMLRRRVASVLKHFDDPTAKAALIDLRKDPDHRVVGAAMEDLLP